jgi:hypothetical protein
VAAVGATVAGTILTAIVTLWPAYLWGLHKLSAHCASRFDLGGLLPVLPGPTHCDMSVGVLPFQLWASLSLAGGGVTLLYMVRLLHSRRSLLGASNDCSLAKLELRTRIRSSRKWIILVILLLVLSAWYAAATIWYYP